MAFNWAEVSDDSPIARVQGVPPDDSVFQEFMDSMISNMQYLGDDTDPNVLLIPGFCCIHRESHSEFECSSFVEAISRVLSKMAKLQETSQREVNIFTVPKKTGSNDDTVRGDPLMDGNPILTTSHLHHEGIKLEDDPTLSYSNTSSNGRGLPPPSNGIVTNPRRRWFVKGQGWKSIPINAKE